jgi:hypothetical protein
VLDHDPYGCSKPNLKRLKSRLVIDPAALFTLLAQMMATGTENVAVKSAERRWPCDHPWPWVVWWTGVPR